MFSACVFQGLALDLQITEHISHTRDSLLSFTSSSYEIYFVLYTVLFAAQTLVSNNLMAQFSQDQKGEDCHSLAQICCKSLMQIRP